MFLAEYCECIDWMLMLRLQRTPDYSVYSTSSVADEARQSGSYGSLNKQMPIFDFGDVGTNAWQMIFA